MSSPGGHADQGPDVPYTIKLDVATRSVHITMQGFWTVEEAMTFHALHIDALRHCREKFGVAKALIEAAGMTIQSREVMEILATRTVYSPGDAVAVVVANTLAKIATRRNMEVYPASVHSNAFTSLAEAETWLGKF